MAEERKALRWACDNCGQVWESDALPVVANDLEEMDCPRCGEMGFPLEVKA